MSVKADQPQTPDETYDQLRAFAGGFGRRSITYEHAVTAVLAFLFERCDIFEGE